MHTAMMLSFQDELEKIASHAAELAGLGILAAPSAAHLGGKEWSEKNKSRAEVAGLGVLAGPSALAVGKKAVRKGKAVLRAANVNKLRKAATEVAKHASRREDIDSIKDTRAGYTERSHRAGKAGGLLGAANALGAASYASRKLKSAPKALGRIGGTTVAGLAAGYGVGVGAHKFIYGHRKPKKKEAAPSTSYSDSERAVLGLAGVANLTGAGMEISDLMKGRPSRLPTALLLSTPAAVAGIELKRKLKGQKSQFSSHVYGKKKESAPSMSAMMNMHRLADAAKAAKNVAKPSAQAAVKLPNQAAQAARASSFANHTAQGGHAWNPAAQAKRAIPL